MSTNDAQIVITPSKSALIDGVAQKLIVLMRVQAPDANPFELKKRKPYHLALTLDRSGSMSGEPLFEAVLCAKYMIDRLNTTDIASLIVFDDRVRTMVPAKEVGDRKVFHQALARIHSGGSTNLYGGWRSGADSILPEANCAALARVLLLSDGNANKGETTDCNAIAAYCAEAAELGVSTSTYGLGRNFNEELMVEMATQGRGNHYYGDTAADLYEPFATEFDLISNLYARQVKLTLVTPKDVKLKLLNDYPINSKETITITNLPDLAYGAEAWALIELEIPATMALASGCELLQAKVSACTPDGEELDFSDKALNLHAISVSAWNVLLDEPLVKTRQAEIEAGAFLAKLRFVTDHEDWETVQKMLEDGKIRFADYSWVIEVLDSMSELARAKDSHRFRKEAFYTSKKMSNRLSAKEEALMFNELNESQSPSYLRRKPSQGKAIFEQRPDEEC